MATRVESFSELCLAVISLYTTKKYVIYNKYLKYTFISTTRYTQYHNNFRVYTECHDLRQTTLTLHFWCFSSGPPAYDGLVP
jgi:hypothetical protein